MSLITCAIDDIAVDQIRSGDKTFEGRTASPYFEKMVKGETVEWHSRTNPENKVLTKIVSARKYPNLEEMLTDIGVEKFFPGIDSVDTAMAKYKSIVMSSRGNKDTMKTYMDKVAKYGALALELKPIKHTPSTQSGFGSSAYQRRLNARVGALGPTTPAVWGAKAYSMANKPYALSDQPLYYSPMGYYQGSSSVKNGYNGYVNFSSNKFGGPRRKSRKSRVKSRKPRRSRKSRRPRRSRKTTHNM
jgi:ASC-1-like (ASCH) protein